MNEFLQNSDSDDKTDQTEKIDLLEKQLSWYKTFFEKATDAVFIVQPESWAVLDGNDYASSLLGVEKDDLIGSQLPQFRRIFKLLMKSGSPVVLSELTLDSSDGRSIMVEVSARFIDHLGERLIQAIARDVSEQHELTDKMVQADKLVLLGQLSAGVVHEIRNPLAAVNLNLQLLKRRLQENENEFAFVSKALQGVERITRIVEVTLNFSRPAVPDVKTMNLNSMIPNVIDLVSTNLKKKDITINLDLSDDLPHVAADSKQMQQVFINLITNAADAVDGKGKISIKSYHEIGGKRGETHYSVVSISDNGKGIPPEDLPKIFNPFFTRKSEGTGLGLPITQRIMHQHNGIIDVDSKLDQGTTFYVKLPVQNYS